MITIYGDSKQNGGLLSSHDMRKILSHSTPDEIAHTLPLLKQYVRVQNDDFVCANQVCVKHAYLMKANAENGLS